MSPLADRQTRSLRQLLRWMLETRSIALSNWFLPAMLKKKLSAACSIDYLSNQGRSWMEHVMTIVLTWTGIDALNWAAFLVGRTSSWIHGIVSRGTSFKEIWVEVHVINAFDMMARPDTYIMVKTCMCMRLPIEQRFS